MHYQQFKVLDLKDGGQLFYDPGKIVAVTVKDKSCTVQIGSKVYELAEKAVQTPFNLETLGKWVRF